MKFCFDKLGVPIIGQIPNPGKLEGGDFFPVGKDLCMVGVGEWCLLSRAGCDTNLIHRAPFEYVCHSAPNE